MMTNYTFKTFSLLGIILLWAALGYAQSIHFNYTDGTNSSYNLDDVRKINFDDNVMNLHLWDGSLYSWNVSTIGYYQYDENPLNVQEWINSANDWKVKVFPNPTSTNLEVYFNLPAEDIISLQLYDMQGKLILENNKGRCISGEHKVIFDLSSLHNGQYLCKITGQKNTITKQVIKP